MEKLTNIVAYKFRGIIHFKNKEIEINHLFKDKREAIKYKTYIMSKLKKRSENKNCSNFDVVTIENYLINLRYIVFINFSITQMNVNNNYNFDTLEGLLNENSDGSN